MAMRTGIIIAVAQMEAVREKYVNLIQQSRITSRVKRKMERELARTQEQSMYLWKGQGLDRGQMNRSKVTNHIIRSCGLSAALLCGYILATTETWGRMQVDIMIAVIIGTMRN